MIKLFKIKPLQALCLLAGTLYLLLGLCVLDCPGAGSLHGSLKYKWARMPLDTLLPETIASPGPGSNDVLDIPEIDLRLKFGKASTGATWTGTYWMGRNWNPPDHRFPMFDVPLSKRFIGVENLGPIRSLYAGNYSASFGLGLVMDSSPCFFPRKIWRSSGIYGDTYVDNRNEAGDEFNLDGIACEMRIWCMDFIYFYSQVTKDAIVNPDGTINCYFSDIIRDGEVTNKFSERVSGGRIQLDSAFSWLPGAHIAVAGFESRTNRNFHPDAGTVFIQDTKHHYADQFSGTCPEYENILQKHTRTVLGTDVGIMVWNMGLDAEYGKLLHGGEARAIKVTADISGMKLLALWRRYDVDYDNPYFRGFSEHSRFDHTMFNCDYMMNNPYYSNIVDANPQPKAEKGLYLEMRYPLTEKLKITRAYIDVWNSYLYDTRKKMSNNSRSYRAQAEIEYRMSRAMRLRLRQKIYQFDCEHNGDITSETLCRTTFHLPLPATFRVDLFHKQKELRISPPNRYNESRRQGSYVGFDTSYSLMRQLSTSMGYVLWNCSRGLSLWSTDNRLPFDFMEDTGRKIYIELRNSLSDNFTITLVVRDKRTDIRYMVDPCSAESYDGFPMGNIERGLEHVLDYGVELSYHW